MSLSVVDLPFVLAAVAYSLATLLFSAHLARRGGLMLALVAGRHVLLAGAICHLISLGVHAFATQQCPMKSTGLGVSFGAMGAVWAYLFLRARLKIEVLGVFVSPNALLFLLAGRLLILQDPSLALQSRLLPLHIAVNVVGDAMFLMASGAAVLYLVQERYLKSKRGDAVFGRLPPLESLDRASHWFVVVGFLLLTLGLVTGTIWVPGIVQGNWPTILRVGIAYLSWGVFCLWLILRSVRAWRGRRSAYGVLGASSLALVVLLLYMLRHTGGLS